MSASTPPVPPGAEPPAAAAAPPAPTPALAPPPAGAPPHGTHDHGDEPHLHPEHFTLSPEVARLPLARRRQRLGAILVDLALVAALTKAFSSVGLLAGAIAGTLLYWAAGRAFAPPWMRRKSARIGLAFALCIAFIAVGQLISHRKADKDEGDNAAAALTRAAIRTRQAEASGKSRVRLATLGLSPRELISLATTEDPAVARALAEKLELRVKSQPDARHTASSILQLVNDEDMPLSGPARAELLRVLRPLAEPEAAGAAAAPDAGVAADPHVAELATLQEENASLTATVELLNEQVDELEEAVDEARAEHGIMHFLKASVHDLGFGIGWSYVYFIGFLVIWKGHTPGKRLFGIRVLRIDGKPMTMWRSFERFHGYAASMVTGFIGFAQVLWDPSRQCLHDKVAETVVVQDRHHATDAVVP